MRNLGVLAVVVGLPLACQVSGRSVEEREGAAGNGGDDGSEASGSGGSAGTAGGGGGSKGGSGGTSGTSGAGGSSGASAGGSGGASGMSGAGGASGSGGASGANVGGSSGDAGTAGTGGGDAGTAGVSGNGGTAGIGGSSGAGGSAGSSGAGNGGNAGTTTQSPCDPNPCQNGGTCADGTGAAVCDCTGGYTGDTCTIPIFELMPGICRAYGVSGNGNVVVGSCSSGAVESAFSWSGSVVTPLPGYQSGPESGALGANQNGLVIVGWTEDADGNRRAVRWAGTSPLSYQPLVTTLEYFSNRASRTNSDGSISVGTAQRTGEYDTAVVWSATSSAPTNIASGHGHEYSFATGVSASGSVVVGYGTDESGGFSWTSAGGYVGLTGLNGATDVNATGVSDDGLVIVGTSSGNAVRWVGSAAESLGAVARPRAVNEDGSVIVGRLGTESFVWTEADGMRTLASVLIEHGVSLTGVTLTDANDISDDGRVIVGIVTTGGEERAFRARMPAW